MSWVVIGNMGSLRYFMKVNEKDYNSFSWEGLINNATIFPERYLADAWKDVAENKSSLIIIVESIIDKNISVQ